MCAYLLRNYASLFNDSNVVVGVKLASKVDELFVAFGDVDGFGSGRNDGNVRT